MTQPFQLTDQPIGGLDATTDPVAVVAPKVIGADNVDLSTPGRARKRPGRRRRAERAQVRILDALSPRTLSVREARWIATEQSGRIMAHVDNLLLSESAGQWMVRGYLDQMRITAGHLIAPAPGIYSFTGGDVGLAGDVLVVALDTGFAEGIQVFLLDAATGAHILPSFFIASYAYPRVLSLPNGNAVILATGNANKIVAVPIVGGQVRQMSVADASGNLRVALLSTVVSDAGAAYLYDACVVNGRIVLAYLNGAGNIGRCYIAANGQIDGAIQTEAPTGVPVALAVHYGDTNGRLLIAWASDAGSFLKARDYNSDATLTANAAIGTLDTKIGCKQITIAVRGTTWTVLSETGGAELHKRIVNRCDWVTSGAPALNVVFLGAALGSKLWTDAVTGKRYCIFAYESQTQPSAQVTYFVYSISNTDDGVNPGPFEEEPYVLVGILWPGYAGGVLAAPYLPAALVTGRSVQIGLLYRTEQNEVSKDIAARVVRIDHAPADMPGAAQGPDGASYAPGGLLWRIDEAMNAGLCAPPNVSWSVSEAGFALAPENLTGVSQAGGNLASNASYGYRCYFRDYATGERSTTFAFTFQTAAGHGTLNVTFPPFSHTNRRTVVADFYRTTANPVPGAPYYYVASAFVICRDYISTDVVGIVDTLADATLITRKRDYITMGEAGEVAPPACGVIAMGQGRAALAGLDDDAAVMITKPRNLEEPLRWSSELAAVADHPVPGRITAMAWNGPDLIVWRARSIQILSGRGPDALGGGGVIEPQQIISDQVGCRSARSLVRVPAGWLFQSADGTYWQFGTDGKLTYVGADVEPLDEPCTGSFVVPARKQVIFVTATRRLVYHYDAGAWQPWSGGAIAAAALPDGTGLYLPSSAAATLLEDDPTTYRDDGVEYNMRIRPAWFRPRGVEGEFTLRRILVSGGYEGPHRPQARIYYDYEPGFQETVTWQADTVVGAVTAGDGVRVLGGPSRLGATQVYSYVIPVARERCMAIAVELIDRGLGGAVPLGASFWVTSLGYEWAPVDQAGGAAFRLEERRVAQ